MNHKKLTLETINQGAAVELFDEAFKKVMNNINDINVPGEAVREITLKFKFKPLKKAKTVVTSVEVTTKLPGVQPNPGSMIIGFEGNSPMAWVADYNQPDLPLSQKSETDQNLK